MLKTKTIRQSVSFTAPPRSVYEALIDPKRHSKFTGAETIIERKVGGVFTAYDGYFTGKILALEPDKRIVLSVRQEEEHWSEDHYSTATFTFTMTKNGTRLDFIQTGVPEERYEDVREGWKTFYWQPMKAMLEKI